MISKISIVIVTRGKDDNFSRTVIGICGNNTHEHKCTCK